MQFGRTTREELDGIDFSLPAEHGFNQHVLPGKPSENFECFIGTTEWGRKDWIGTLYPYGSRPADFLKHYAKHFNSIELNPTHYRIPSVNLIQKWVDTVPDDFVFCPKVYQEISHARALNNSFELTEAFCAAIRHFGTHLGMVFLQLKPNFGPKQFTLLRAYLEQWPDDIPLSVELREPEWFEHTNTATELFTMLHELQVSAVITDTGKHRSLVHMRLATNQLLVRFVGNGLHPTDYKRIDAWVERINHWKSQGLERLYFFVHQHDGLHAPELIEYTAQKMNEQLNINLRFPRLGAQPFQGELF